MKVVNGHKVFEPKDPHPKWHRDNSHCYICDHGLGICSVCGKAGVELDEPCRSIVSADYYGDVRSFALLAGGKFNAVPDLVSVERKADRVVQVANVAKGVMVALKANDLGEISKSLLNLIYLAMDTFLIFGIDPAPLWGAMAEYNKSKLKKMDSKEPSYNGLIAIQSIKKGAR